MWHFHGSKHTMTLPTYFRGSEPPNPQDLRPWWATRAVDDQSWGGQHEPWSLRIVDDGSPVPTFWSFVLGNHNVSPVQQQRDWLEDIVCLQLIRHKNGSIVSISRISEVIMSKCSSQCPTVHRWCCETCSIQQFWMKECDIFRGQNILWPSYIFSGRQDTQPPRIYAPDDYYDY